MGQIKVVFQGDKPPVATDVKTGEVVRTPEIAIHAWVTGHEIAFTKYDGPHCAECSWRGTYVV